MQWSRIQGEWSNMIGYEMGLHYKRVFRSFCKHCVITNKNILQTHNCMVMRTWQKKLNRNHIWGITTNLWEDITKLRGFEGWYQPLVLSEIGQNVRNYPNTSVWSRLCWRNSSMDGKEWHGCQHEDTFSLGTSMEVKFLGNLKPLDKKLDLYNYANNIYSFLILFVYRGDSLSLDLDHAIIFKIKFKIK